MISLKLQTLHSHTNYSDGNLTHLELLKVCADNGVGVVGFTDHDSVPNEKEIKKLRNYQGPVKWVMGIEISSGVHIVGLFINPRNKDLLKHCEYAQKARVERMEKIVRNLKSLGFEITENDCLRASRGEAVGRPHIVEAIKSKEVNLQILEQLRLKMKRDAETDENIKKKYLEMMEEGERSYPYQLFLSENAYIKGIYIDYLYQTDINKSVSLVRNAGGIALLAHWLTYKQKYPVETLDKMLMENQLDGLETTYGLWTGEQVAKKIIIDDRKILRKLVKKHQKLEGGGVDAHNKEDIKLFAQSRWYNRWTEGMVENIVEKSKVDRIWSSL